MNSTRRKCDQVGYSRGNVLRFPAKARINPTEHTEPVQVIATRSGPITTAAEINKANAEFWSMPDANVTQRMIAEMQSTAAIRGGHDHRRTRRGTDGLITKGKKTVDLVNETVEALKVSHPKLGKSQVPLMVVKALGKREPPIAMDVRTVREVLKKSRNPITRIKK